MRMYFLHACLSVCLFASISHEPHLCTSPNVLCMLPMTVARSFSGDVAIRYVLPVLWMTSHVCTAVAKNWRQESAYINSV